MRLKDRAALVTGSSSGIGLAIARALAAEGARLVVNGRNAPAVERAAREIRGAGGVALGVPADVTDPSQVEALVRAGLEAFARLDILVNNAGGTRGMPVAGVEEVTEEAWDHIVALNLKAAFLCSRAVAKHMRAQGGGKIVNITSEAARRPHPSLSAGLQYASAKAGLAGLTRALAAELGPYGINVNAVAPGFTLANQRQMAYWESRPAEERELTLREIPLGRLATPEDIAPVVVFLASDDARYITGITIDVNGGRTLP